MPVLKARKGSEAELWKKIADARNELLLSLATSPWPDFRKKTQTLERRFLKEADTEKQRQEVRRAFSSDRLLGASEALLAWRQLRPFLQRVEDLGYSNLMHQQQIVGVFIEWTIRARQGLSQAEEALMRLERRVRRTCPPGEMRERMMKTITDQWERLKNQQA